MDTTESIALPDESETVAGEIEAGRTYMIRFYGGSHQLIRSFSEVAFLHEHPHQTKPFGPRVRAWIINKAVEFRDGLD